MQLPFTYGKKLHWAPMDYDSTEQKDVGVADTI